MSMTDPIADMLTRIRNATLVRHDRADVPASKMKLEIAKILKQEGFIRTFKVLEEGPRVPRAGGVNRAGQTDRHAKRGDLSRRNQFGSRRRVGDEGTVAVERL